MNISHVKVKGLSHEMEKSPKEKRGWPICKSASGIEGVHKNALESIHFCKTFALAEHPD